MTKSPAGVRLTPCAYAIARLVATCASLVLAAGCDGRSSPTAADGPLQQRILGMVSDEVRRSLSGATIRVLDGPMAGTPTVTTDASGRFELYSTTPGTVTLQVNRAGFKSALHTTRWQPAINVAIEWIGLESRARQAFQLDPGEYTVTISMNPAAASDIGSLPPCAGFPSEMMSRTYKATIAESSHSSFDKAVSLEGPTVFSNSEFGFLLGAQFIGFEIEYPFTEELSGFRVPEHHRQRTDQRTSDGFRTRGVDSLLGSLPVLRAGRSSEAGLGKLSTRFHRAIPRMRFKQRSDGVHQTLRFSSRGLASTVPDCDVVGMSDHHTLVFTPRWRTKMTQTINRRARRRRRTLVPAVLGRARGALLMIALAGISSCDQSPAAPSPAAEQPGPSIGLEPGTYTLAVTVDLANARDWKERPDAPCAGFPVELASRSYRAEIKEPPWPTSVYTHAVTAQDSTLRWHDLFAFFVSGSYVGFGMEGGAWGGIYENFPGFRYLEIGGHTKPTEPAVRSGSSVSVTFAGAVCTCHLKSARGVDEDCYQVPAEQILEHHVCMSDRHTLVFTPR